MARYLRVVETAGKTDYVNLDVYHVGVYEPTPGVWKVELTHAYNPIGAKIVYTMTLAEKNLFIGYLESGLAVTAVRAASPKIDGLK